MATIDLNAIADTQAVELFPDTNFGSLDTLGVNALSPYRRNAFLKFDLHGIKGITSAKLSLHILYFKQEELGLELQIRRSSSTWTENTLTWNVRPGVYTGLKSFMFAGLRGYLGLRFDFGITELAQLDEDDFFSVRISLLPTTTTTNFVNFASREYEGLEPILEVTYEEVLPLKITNVATRLIDSYAPCRTEFHTTWSGGEAPYTLDIVFGDGDTEHVTGIAATWVYTSHTYLDPGTYNWTATVSDAVSSDSDSGSITIPEAPLEATTVDIGSSPPGARIYIDNSDIGIVTPFTWFTEPGTYLITLKLDGYDDWEIVITIPEPGTYSVDAFLSETVEEGWITATKNFLTNTLPGWLTAIPGVIADTAANVLNINNIIGVTIPNTLQTAKNYADALFGIVETVIPQWIIDAANSVLTWWDDTVTYVGTKVQDAKDYALGLAQTIVDYLPQWLIDAVNSVNTWWDDTVAYVTGAITDVKTWVTTAISTATDWIAKTASDAWDWATTTGKDLYNWFTDKAKDAVNWVSGAGVDLFNDFYAFLDNPGDWLDDKLTSFINIFIATDEEINERFKEVNPLPDSTLGGLE